MIGPCYQAWLPNHYLKFNYPFYENTHISLGNFLQEHYIFLSLKNKHNATYLRYDALG